MLKALGVVGLGVTLLCSTSAAAARQTVPHPHGNAVGLSLLKRVNAAYRHVPAVQTSARINGVSDRFTLLLRNGVATAEQFVGAGPGGTTTLVARGTGPTFAREAGSTCWRRLEPTDSQSLEDVGIRFPDAYRMLVKAPRRAGGAWLLPAVSQGRSPGEKVSVTMRIDPSTMLVETETAGAGGHKLTEHVKSLARRPRIASPTSRC